MPNDATRRTVEAWIDQASGALQSAKQLIGSPSRSIDVVQASQRCIELSVKAVLTVLGITYPKSHAWEPETKPSAHIARQIAQGGLIPKLESHHFDYAVPLPRLLLLMNLWGHLYLVSKCGFESEFLAPAQQLFRSEEAKLAVNHADECLRAASELRYLRKDEIDTLLAQ